MSVKIWVICENGIYFLNQPYLLLLFLIHLFVLYWNEVQNSYTNSIEWLNRITFLKERFIVTNITCQGEDKEVVSYAIFNFTLDLLFKLLKISYYLLFGCDSQRKRTTCNVLEIDTFFIFVKFIKIQLIKLKYLKLCLVFILLS